jgi:murein DD-endopeptidase MepM/ murein hydrolase activator NlpD
VNRAQTRWLPIGRLGWFIVLLAFFSASSPAIAQRTPRFLFPALAVVGGKLALVFFARALSRLVRTTGERRRAVLPLLVNAVAMLVLVVFPGVRFIEVMTPASGRVPRVLAGFGDWRGSEGYPRMTPHRGLDVAARPGSDVLAAADGRITVARDHGDLCGLIVVIAHDPHGYRTVYCHLARIAVERGEVVRRGQPIGAVGTTGQRAWPGYEHVHFELQRGTAPKDIEDPSPRMGGCFDATARYPAERLVLTYPVRCGRS